MRDNPRVLAVPQVPLDTAKITGRVVPLPNKGTGTVVKLLTQGLPVQKPNCNLHLARQLSIS